MSGYFTRLLTRAQAKESAVHPQTPLPFNAAPFLFSTSPLAMDTASSGEADIRHAKHPLRTSAQPSKMYRQAPRENPPGHLASVATSLEAFAPSAKRRFDHAATESEPLGGLSPDTALQEPVGQRDNSPPLEDLHAMPSALDISEVSTALMASAASAVLTAPADPAAAEEIERDGSHNGDFRLMPEVERSASNYPPLHTRSVNSAANLYPAQSVLRNGSRQRPVSAEASEVHVTIGRIEVTAVQAATPEKRTQTEQRRPIMSLDEYLSRRRGGNV